jgi:hypothetical protein
MLINVLPTQNYIIKHRKDGMDKIFYVFYVFRVCDTRKVVSRESRVENLLLVPFDRLRVRLPVAGIRS